MVYTGDSILLIDESSAMDYRGRAGYHRVEQLGEGADDDVVSLSRADVVSHGSSLRGR